MRQPNLKSIATRICFRYLPVMVLSMLFSIHMNANSIADITPPVLNCPGTINIQLLPGECEAIVNYSVSATDNLDPNPTITLISGLASGSSFPIGTTSVAYQANDSANNLANCSFDVVVNEYVAGNIECQSFVNLSLDNNCEAYITPAYILQGQYGCYENYTAQIVDANGNVVPPLVDGIYLGQILTITVTQNSTNLSCSGNINVEDYSAPIIECDDTAIFCYEGTSPYDLLAAGNPAHHPTAYDNCDTDLDLTYTDITTPLDCSIPINGGYFLSKIERTWTATDDAGHSNTCTQTIYSKRVFVYDIDCPENADNIKGPALDCSDDPSDLSITGQPMLNGIPVNDLTSCNLSVSYTDSIANICGGSYRIYRNWKMVDLCPDGEIVYNYPYVKGIIDKIQVLDFLDTTAPTFSCPDSLSIGTSSNNCSGTLNVPPANVTDDCSNVTVSTITPDGIVHNSNGGIVVSDLTIGTHNLIYVAKDDCGNISSCIVPVVVHDCIAPEIACVQDLTVSVNNTNINEICADQLDAGSTDNCSSLTYEIRRTDAAYGSPFMPCVYFECSDVNSSFQVEMIARDEYGNEDDCIVTIQAIDDVIPTLNCPADISIDCQADYTDLTLTGDAMVSDQCGLYTVIHTDNVVFGNCGLDTIFRTFTVEDTHGNINTCTQTIVQINPTPFYINDTDATNADPNDGVEWPANFATQCSNTSASILPESLPTSPVNYAQPKLHFSYCDEIQLSYTDSLISGNINDCYSLARTWLIRDWCNYDPANPAAGGAFEYVQLISVGDIEAPVFTSECADISVCNYDQNCGFTFAHLEVNATDNCTSDSDLIYFYGIDLHNDGTIDANGLGNTIDDLYPLGQHKVVFEVNDGCGNIATCEYFFVIEDCVKPNPDCNQSVTLSLAANGLYNLTVSELESGNSYDNCSDYNDLVFSFSNNAIEPIFQLNCAYVGSYDFELWATDQNGNQARCNTTVILDDPTGACDEIINPSPMVNIAGYVQDESGNMVEDVAIGINSGATGMESTDVAGDYNFTNLPIGNNYVVTPTKDLNLLNGVTTLDLVLITRHILGVQPLSSPYKIIAADVNHSNTITTLDVVNLQRVILGIDNVYNNNTSWRFVDMDYVFPNTSNPFASNFPEVITYNNLQSDELFTDFIGVKIGDVNCSASPNLNNVQTRNNNQLNLEIANSSVDKNQEYVMDITSSQLENLLGYQLTLDISSDAAELLEVIPGKLSGLSIENFGLTQMDRGVITANWFSVNPLKLKSNEVLFSLKVKAKRKLEVKDIITISQAPTIDYAYKETKTGIDEFSIGLTFRDEFTTNENPITSISNSPNPFKVQTTISFELLDEEAVTLEVIDLNGRIVLEKSTNGTKGINEITIDAEELKETGIYYYQIKTKGYTKTKKLIFVK